MANKQHIFRALVPPSSAPTEDGHHYIDTVAKKMYFSVGTTSVSDWIQLGATTGTANALAYFNPSGNLASSTVYSINTNNGIDSTFTLNPNNGAGNNLLSSTYNFVPLQNSPNETWTVYNNQINLDPTSTGFTFGTAGQSARYFHLYFNHQGTGNTGEVNFFLNNFNLGNGTDPISVKGISYFYSQGQVNAGVTINGPIQGYGIQPSFNASSVLTGAYFNGFYNFSNCLTAINGWTELQLSPTISEITNNSNYTGANFNPTITTFSGNASVNIIGIAGSFGTFSTGNFNGININPTITSIVNANGLTINMNNVTASGTKKAIDATGDVSITGALSFSGALSIGQLSAFATQAVVDGGGTPTSIHSLVTSPTVGNSLTIANADTIGVNTAMLLTVGTGSTVTSGAFGLGIAALALPAVVTIGAGSTVDKIDGAVFAINLSSGSGTVDKVYGGRGILINISSITANKYYGWSSEVLTGPATKNWGVHSNLEYNFLQSLKIGGTVDVDDFVSNSSIGLQFSVTKAPVLPNVTTTEKNALTAVNGMMVYDTTLGKGQIYEAGAWVNLV